MKRRFSSLNSDGQDIIERPPYKSQFLGFLYYIQEVKKKLQERARTKTDVQNWWVKKKPEISAVRVNIGVITEAVNTVLTKLGELGMWLGLESTLVKLKDELYEITIMMRTFDELYLTAKKPLAVRDDQKHTVPQFNQPQNIWNIPHDLLRKLSEYLTEDELFEARGVHRIFYRAFYELRLGVETQTAFNFRRALKLAQMGRVFKNLEFFYCEVRGQHDNKIPECLNLIHFPALSFLEINGGNSVPVNVNRRSEDEDKSSHPNIRTVQIQDCRAELLIDERFPNIKELICIGQVHFLGCRLSKLQLIKFHDFPNDFEEISRETFPSLEKIVFAPHTGIISGIEDIEVRLREEGVSVIFSK